MRFSFFKTAPVSKPERLTIPYGSHEFDVLVKARPTCKRLTLKIARSTGDIVLTMPKSMSYKRAEAFAREHAGWIAARLARQPERIRLLPGASLPIRGISHRIVKTVKGRGRPVQTFDEDGQAIILVSGQEEHIPRRLMDYLKVEARRELTACVKRYETLSGLSSSQITVRDTTSRWGSCSSRGALNFSWRLILAPDFVLDYLVAHEVAHLKHMNHSVAFWKYVKELCPHTDDAEKWLKKHAAELHRYSL